MELPVSGGGLLSAYGHRFAARMRSVLFAFGLTGILLSFGCGGRRSNVFRLEGEPLVAVLIPPAPKMTPDGEAIQLRRGQERSGCDIQNPVITLAWRGSNARLVPHSDAARDMSNVEVGRHLQEFRAEAFRLQARGCFRAADVNRLLSAMAVSMALPPVTAFELRYGPSMATGYVDLLPGFQLEEVTVMKAASGQPAGQRKVLFKVQSRAGGGVGVVEAGRPELVWYPGRSGAVPPALNLNFPAEAKVWRLAWRVAASRADHFNMVIAAIDHSALEDATKHLEQTPADCARVGTIISGSWCAALSPDTVLTAELPVEVQSHRVFLPITSTVGNAMAGARILDPADVMPHLKVWRRYGSRLCPVQFDPTSKTILRLTLMAGDKLQW